MQDGNSSRALGGLVLIAALVLPGIVVSVYIVAYFTTCETFGSASLVSKSSPEIQITFNGQPFLDRMYTNQASATLFSPAAKLESWMTGVRVSALDRSTIDFDFNIDSTIIPAPSDVPGREVGLDPNGRVYE